VTNVVVVGRDVAPDACVGDARFSDVMDAALAAPNMVELVLFAIREYPTHHSLVNGRGGEAVGLASHVSRRRLGRGERNRAKRIVRALDGLYRDFDPSHVRGLLIEKLVEQQIRPRYSGAGDICDNNVRIEIGPTHWRHETSTGFDVLGWDGTEGEGHDCKADAVSWRDKKDWIAELDSEVVPRGLAVGLVTADSKSTAERKLAREGIRHGRLVLIDADRLFMRLPLCRRRHSGTGRRFG
jgi:hypothetical protein